MTYELFSAVPQSASDDFTWSITNPSFNPIISIENNKLQIKNNKSMQVQFYIKATTLGLKSAFRKFKINNFDCINQLLEPKFKDGIYLNYNATNGTFYIPYQINSLFEWSEPSCPVSKMIF